MYGAIMGDIVGSRFEFDRGDKTKEFRLFTEESEFTDDTVMSIAVAEALIKHDVGDSSASEEVIKYDIIQNMKRWGRKYPDAGYGNNFSRWIFSADSEPYGSYGNGSAMRVSSVGWLYDSLDKTREVARWTAEVTHNHPEGIKGAEATASVIYLARNGYDKEYIRDYVVREFAYDLSRNCDEIRPTYHHVESCQETVPEAITAFLEGQSFIDVVRTAVSLGGDCDTLTCIATAMAEAYYGFPNELIPEIEKRLDNDLKSALWRFDKVRNSVCKTEFKRNV
ncbi:ADP-ribosylglycohydrolase family protein [Eubacterium xylanophilum]|uniref:ADP-ribosylglycohydrolase family protein n=1 Tax=Eubacterium xylanophilum TaxID=39497 RepID=UPI0004BC84E2|nr:ADP-ribosylglycohydrolase family protein [Eubacterium xylanophilum]